MTTKGPYSSSELVLFQHPGDGGLDSLSPRCAKVHLALRRLELPYFVVDVKSPFAARHVSPTGRLPVLQVGGRRVADSVAILDALEEMRPERPLSPLEPAARADDRAWEHVANDTAAWMLYYFRWCVEANATRFLHAIVPREDWASRLAVTLIVGPQMRMRARGHGIGSWSLDEVVRAWNRTLGLFEARLGGGPFLGSRTVPGRADLAVASLLAQVPWRDAMPQAHEGLRGRSVLEAHVVRTHEACHAAVPPGFQA